MAAKIFIKKTQIDASAADLFAWHAREGAINRLTPPWAPLQQISRKGKGIDKGVQVKFKIRVMGIPMIWEAQHIEYEENRMFRDRQVKGPFGLWEHTHHFHKVAENRTIMEDQVKFKLPMEPFSLPFYGYAMKELERIFSYRHQVLKADMEKRVGKIKQQRILISGASGTIGQALVPFLRTCGHEVIRLVRDPNTDAPDTLYWDPYQNILDLGAAGPIDAVINLNGVDITRGTWTDKQKKRIIDSRVIPTQVLVEKMGAMADPPATFISSSAIGLYGEGADRKLTEGTPKGDSFISEVCHQWETASLGAERRGIRTIQLRIGVVMTPAGGALKRMFLPFALGLGIRFSQGRQYMSWISMEDVLAGILHLLEKEDIHGPVNLTAPVPEINKAFSQTLGRVLSRPVFLVMPAPVITSLWGDMGKETMLTSARVIPLKLLDSGYQFTHATLEPALRHLLGR
ncbi:MAG: TIGR01777 family protein [Desulfobacter postgatei]|uniref:TIGR01777 family protein n=1 Tax=Desulfobacter postgatei TaxID=2293 RepID=A0A2G6MT09_9BACT|nr:MAG: TIGR01777 family protein [Desulfobacter postgatei]